MEPNLFEESVQDSWFNENFVQDSNHSFRVFSEEDPDPTLDAFPTWDRNPSRTFTNLFRGISPINRLVRQSSAIITSSKANRLGLLGIKVEPGQTFVGGLVHCRIETQEGFRAVDLCKFSAQLDNATTRSNLTFIRRELSDYFRVYGEIETLISKSMHSTDGLMELVGRKQDVLTFLGTYVLPKGFLCAVENPIGFLDNTAPLLGTHILQLTAMAETNPTAVQTLQQPMETLR